MVAKSGAEPCCRGRDLTRPSCGAKGSRRWNYGLSEMYPRHCVVAWPAAKPSPSNCASSDDGEGHCLAAQSAASCSRI